MTVMSPKQKRHAESDGCSEDDSDVDHLSLIEPTISTLKSSSSTGLGTLAIRFLCRCQNGIRILQME